MIDLRDAAADPAAICRALGLQPHPEGGHYRETWRDAPSGAGRDAPSGGGPAAPVDGGRGAGTAILFLLRAGERSHWHRVDATELWIWQAGGALRLEIAGQPPLRLGPDLREGDTLHGVVPAHAWQAAESLGAWTLCTCVVAPAFSFDGFELAPPGWTPPVGDPGRG